MHAVDDEADAQVLAGLVARPLPAGLDEDRHRVVGLALDALDAPAQLLRRPQRVDQLEVVVGQQRREQRAQRAAARGAAAPGPAGRAPRSAIGGHDSPLRTTVNHAFSATSRRLPCAHGRSRDLARATRERELVAATRALFDERGMQDAPIEEIARAVGIARGLIYRHFSSKEELFVLTVTDYLRRARRRARRRRSSPERRAGRAARGAGRAPTPASACATRRSWTARCR